MGNQSHDVRNHNNSTQRQTQHETRLVTWSNQEGRDEASVEYILSMVDMEIEPTTPETAIFYDVTKEDNDQDDIEENDDPTFPCLSSKKKKN